MAAQALVPGSAPPFFHIQSCRVGKTHYSTKAIPLNSRDARNRETMPDERVLPLPCPEERPGRKRALPAANRKRAPESQPEREIFARNLRRARIDANLSQRELARNTGIAQAHISEMENAMHNVCIDTMVKLAQAVRKPLYELFQP